MNVNLAVGTLNVNDQQLDILLNGTELYLFDILSKIKPEGKRKL